MNVRLISIASALLVIAWLGLAPGCGSGGGSYDKNAPFGRSTASSMFEFSHTGLDGKPVVYTGAINGTKTVGSTIYTQFSLTAGTSTMDLLITPYPLGKDDTTITFGGFSTSDGVSIVPTEPLVLDGRPELNTPVKVTMSFTATLPQLTTNTPLTLNATYTLLSNDASVETAMGMVHGCKHYTVTGAVTGSSLPSYLDGITLSGELYYHESLGLVLWKIPELGVGGDLRSVWDLGDSSGSTNTIRKTGMITNTNPTFKLDTYDRKQTFDADKNTHAKMLLELRWLDETKAKTGTAPSAPGVRIEFGTAMGYFPAGLVESPVSIFHPEENGKGYKYWIAYVDQAAKNELGDNGIAYHIKVSIDPGAAPSLRATARIYYKLISK